ncbi:putative F-box protein At4g38870 [Rutidosis leptorrhynchoides]|uniref:putative F-box protein At4g38870 n=1 Tax=Rutidosis leptorrhynchoides TaxID=125765 RepID=UPI003A99D1B6
MQFRSVAKSWKSLIDSSRFVSVYNLRQIHPHIFVMYFLPGYLGLRCVSIFYGSNFPNNMVDLSEILPDSAKQSTRLTLVGSCQGLLCLDSGSSAIIWNPWIRKSVTINFPDSDYRKYERVVGFGVCPKTIDPKLVHFTFSWNWLENKSWKVEVYSLSPRFWRSRSFSKISDLLCESIELSSDSECVDGFIYWCASNKDVPNRREVIISFDLTNEEFGVIYLPDNLARHSILYLSKYRKSLVLLPDDYNTYVHDVWIMKGGNTKLFKRLFTIKSFDRLQPMAISYNGEVVLKITQYNGNYYEKSIKTYEPSLKRFKWTAVTGTLGVNCMSSYMESMLLHDY